MKFKKQLWAGLAVAAVSYCVLAYISMWPPVVHYARATRSAWTCVNNLRQIDAAMNQFCVEHNKHAGDPVALADITPYIHLNSQGQIPSCPDGGIYNFIVLGPAPTCSLGTNTTESEQIRVGFFQCSDNPKFYLHHVMPLITHKS